MTGSGTIDSDSDEEWNMLGRRNAHHVMGVQSENVVNVCLCTNTYTHACSDIQYVCIIYIQYLFRYTYTRVSVELLMVEVQKP